MNDKEKELIKELEESVKHSLQIVNELGKLYHNYFSSSLGNIRNKQLLIDTMGKEEFEDFQLKKMKNSFNLATMIHPLKSVLEGINKVKSNNDSTSKI